MSNLSFLSKILEKVALLQLHDHLKRNNLLYSLQSAHRVGHSTETALLKIVNDLLSALDDGKVSLLSLLDLSAAFDTIDHATLLSRLQHTFGISANTLSWFSSYLYGRTQTVSVHGFNFQPADLEFGFHRALSWALSSLFSILSLSQILLLTIKSPTIVSLMTTRFISLMTSLSLRPFHSVHNHAYQI